MEVRSVILSETKDLALLEPRFFVACIPQHDSRFIVALSEVSLQSDSSPVTNPGIAIVKARWNYGLFTDEFLDSEASILNKGFDKHV
jgi:hypothetical protein